MSFSSSHKFARLRFGEIRELEGCSQIDTDSYGFTEFWRSSQNSWPMQRTSGISQASLEFRELQKGQRQGVNVRIPVSSNLARTTLRNQSIDRVSADYTYHCAIAPEFLWQLLAKSLGMPIERRPSIGFLSRLLTTAEAITAAAAVAAAVASTAVLVCYTKLLQRKGLVTSAYIRLPAGCLLAVQPAPQKLCLVAT